jgi:L-alanine-DL-glutamate epimerase-like enolase superfamily enzyme
MKITDIKFNPIHIPFKVPFAHSSAKRSVTEAVITTVRSTSGRIGYGEGCPRSYVTHESVDTAQTFFNRIKSSIIEIDSYTSLVAMVEKYHVDINANPAAWCSIETAILDLLGKEQQQSLETILGLEALSGVFEYTAVLGLAHVTAFQKQLAKYSKLGFTDFKIKLSGSYADDKANIAALAKLANIRVRVDANNHWHNATEAYDYIRSLNYPFWAIEEPLRVGDYSALAQLSSTLQSKIILDESFMRQEQFGEIGVYATPWIINIRISKMGGIIRSLNIAKQARQRGYPIIIGAQVGETSILTRLAMTLAHANRSNLLAQEGAFGTYLLEHDMVKNPIMFAEHGHVTASIVAGNGLGLMMLEEVSGTDE